MVRAGSTDVLITNRYRDKPALYRFSAEAPPEIVKFGDFTNPRTTADGQWVIATKPSPGENNLTSMIRINLTSNRESPTALPPAKVIETILFCTFTQ